jgi:cyanate permease
MPAASLGLLQRSSGLNQWGVKSPWFVFNFLQHIKTSTKHSQYIGVVIVLIGTIVQVTAKTVAHLIVGRIVTGVGVGIMTAIVPTVRETQTLYIFHKIGNC